MDYADGSIVHSNTEIDRWNEAYNYMEPRTEYMIGDNKMVNVNVKNGQATWPLFPRSIDEPILETNYYNMYHPIDRYILVKHLID